MAQTAVPIADTTLGNYTNGSGGTTNIYDKIDETVAAASDLDYIKCPSAPVNEVYVCQLTALSDPNSSSDHVISARVRKDVAGGGTIDFDVQLREGYVNEGSPGTLIATLEINDVTSSYATSTYTLSAAEANSITDYGDLYLRVICNQT